MRACNSVPPGRKGCASVYNKVPSLDADKIRDLRDARAIQTTPSYKSHRYYRYYGTGRPDIILLISDFHCPAFVWIVTRADSNCFYKFSLMTKASQRGRESPKVVTRRWLLCWWVGVVIKKLMFLLDAHTHQFSLIAYRNVNTWWSVFCCWISWQLSTECQFFRVWHT